MKPKARSATTSYRLALLGALAALFLLAPVASAWADGNLEVTVAGSGTGAVTSTAAAQYAIYGATVTTTPGQIDCDQTGNPVCAANFTENFHMGVYVTLAAAPGAGSYFAGWSVSGASASSRCETPPAEDETCKVTLSGNPGPTAELTATFKTIPDPPAVLAGGAGAGANFGLRTLEGTVDPEGGEIESCRFEYGPTSEYGTTSPCDQSGAEIGEGTTPEPVTASTEPLEPGTTYHFRLLASNYGGASQSADATFATGPAPVGTCPNEARRQEQGIAALLLPACMALELASPAGKGGQPVHPPDTSASGDRVRFRTAAALGETPGPLSAADLYVASRGGAGWSTQSTSPPVDIVTGWEGNGKTLSYTPDFSRWFQIGATNSQFQVGIGQAFEGGLGGLYSPLSPVLKPLSGGEKEYVRASSFQGASADHTHLYFTPGPSGIKTASYRSGDPQPTPVSADHNTYIASLDANGRPALQLLAEDRSGKNWGGNCGARLGGSYVSGIKVDARNQGAVSVDGSRVYFSTRPSQPEGEACSTANKLRILERLESNQGPWIGELIESECERTEPTPCSGVNGDDFYQGASMDQSRVYFTTNRQLVNTDEDGSSSQCSTTGAAVAGCDLYLYDSSRPVGHKLVQVSAGETNAEHQKGKEADVYNDVTAISADGSHVYFVAKGVLTEEPNASLPAGHRVAVKNQPNLYVWDAGTETTSFVGTLSTGDQFSGIQNNPGLWGGAGTWRNAAYPVPINGAGGVAGDGHVLVFRSMASLTENDTDGGKRDVFRFDADTRQITCLSCVGVADSEPFDVSSRGSRTLPGTDFAEEGRWVSEDGESVLFGTAEPLVAGDVNGTPDNYLWRKGNLYRLPGLSVVDSSGTQAEPATLSHDGDTVAFLTRSRLLPLDGDTTVDAYVARVGGGFAEAPPPIECTVDQASPGEHCQQGEAAPAGPAIGAAPANVRPRPSCRPAARRAHRLSRRARLLRRRAARHNPRQARRMRRKSRRLARRARALSKRARRCRRANRRAGR